MLYIMVAIVAIVIVMVATSIAVFTLASAPQSPENEPAKDANLLRLLERLVRHPYMPYELFFYPCELPEGLPVEIPIPDDAELIGSQAWDNELFVVVLDVPGEPEAVVEFYRERLTELGWVEIEELQPGGGFTPTFGPSASFCRQKSKGPHLSIYTLVPEEDGPVDVRIELNNDCTCGDWPLDVGRRVLPDLKPPKGVHHMSSSAGSSRGSGYSTENSETIMETDLDPGELEAHYRDQLQKAGWELQEKYAGESFAWSAYSFTDEQGNRWKGLLMIQAVGENTRIAILTAARLY